MKPIIAIDSPPRRTLYMCEMGSYMAFPVVLESRQKPQRMSIQFTSRTWHVLCDDLGV